jgi:long-chain acyl-CoA synthetase
MSTKIDGRPSWEDLLTERVSAAGTGMGLAVTARHFGELPAVHAPAGTRTFGELNARANQLSRALRARGLGEESAVGLLCSNRPEFVEAIYAGQRSGFRTVPINWHLTADEIAYILSDSGAVALIADARFAHAAQDAAALAPSARVRLSIGGDVDGFDSYDRALAAEEAHDIDDPIIGRHMMYTSGTTGRPKGVFRPGGALGGLQLLQTYLPLLERFAYSPGEDVHLATGPLYHSAPLVFSLLVPLMAGAEVILMDGWDARVSLETIERHRVTHSHMVPTMFHRLVSVPAEERAAYDLSSLRFIMHGAAPCPVSVKRSIIDWLGPIVYEYYAATEGMGTWIDPEEWLAHPGSVGKPDDGKVVVRDESGGEAAPGEVGVIYLRSEEHLRFEYYKDPDKTAQAYDRDHFTLGDMGYLDSDGYLYLSDRTADLIISGGVNIYPAEVDAVLLGHRAVEDVATIGVPNDEWGEEVKAVVQPREGVVGDGALEAELIEHCRAHLAHYKCPRSVDFTDALPRYDTGKIYRRSVREPYWQERAQKI